MTDKTSMIVTVGVGDCILGLPLDVVHEINAGLDCTPVPSADVRVLGVVNLRGEIVTLLDLGETLFGAPSKSTSESRTVIVQHDGERIGLRVDSIGDVMTLPPGAIEPLPSHMGEEHRHRFKGVVQREGDLVLVGDAAQLLAVGP